MSEKSAKIVSINPIGQRAIALIERWGPCPSVPDGEDSSGKQKARVLNPLEMARRAVEIAEAIEKELYLSGHMEDV